MYFPTSAKHRDRVEGQQCQQLMIFFDKGVSSANNLVVGECEVQSGRSFM